MQFDDSRAVIDLDLGDEVQSSISKVSLSPNKGGCVSRVFSYKAEFFFYRKY